MNKKEKVVKLNKFEETRLLSARALELSKGSKANVKVEKKTYLGKDYVEVAKQELDSDKMDLEIYKEAA